MPSPFPAIRRTFCILGVVGCVGAALMQTPLAADDSERILALDHFVRAPAMPGAATGSTLYMRERVKAGLAARGGAGTRVALFVHGAGTPAEVSFDVPFRDFSWMAYLAAAGFDVFSVDMTGYGRSTRIPAMSDPCNIPANRQTEFVPALLVAPCAPTMTTQGNHDRVGLE
jgi:pimeloyl-ACP methyl ester carboxylesterase